MKSVTPAALGFRMPAEWEPHEATWLAWPHEPRDWPGKLALIPWVYGEVVRHLSVGERVRILVGDAATQAKARKLLTRVGVELGAVDFVRIPTDRSWTRDTCPTFVVRDPERVPRPSRRGLAGAAHRNARDRPGSGNAVAMINWRFNGWAKYPNHRRDDAINDKIAAKFELRQWKPTVTIAGKPWRVVLEGGAIDVNGAGTLLATEECLLDDVQARNPGLSREELEAVLAEHLGVRKVLWLGRGIAGDDTHGHVDDLARFVDETTVVLATETDPGDANYEPLRENRERLAAMTTADGHPIRVVPLPMPAPLYLDGIRLPASYANFYIANGVVLMPTFNDPNDRRTLEILAGLFPGRRVVGIHAVDLVWGLGTLHCMSQQQPWDPERVPPPPR